VTLWSEITEDQSWLALRFLENVKVFSKSLLGYVEVFWRSSKRPLENVKVFSKSLLGYVEVFWRSSRIPLEVLCKAFGSPPG
jgi:hypothetical protein